MKRKSIAMFLAVLALTFGLVAVPKESAAFVYDVYSHEIMAGESGLCSAYVKRTYNVDAWNQVTLVTTTIVFSNCN